MSMSPEYQHHEDLRLGKSLHNAAMRAARAEEDALVARARHRYLNDAEFHAKVDRAVSISRAERHPGTAALAVAVALVMAEVEGL